MGGIRPSSPCRHDQQFPRLGLVQDVEVHGERAVCGHQPVEPVAAGGQHRAGRAARQERDDLPGVAGVVEHDEHPPAGGQGPGTGPPVPRGRPARTWSAPPARRVAGPVPAAGRSVVRPGRTHAGRGRSGHRGTGPRSGAPTAVRATSCRCRPGRRSLRPPWRAAWCRRPCPAPPAPGPGRRTTMAARAADAARAPPASCWPARSRAPGPRSGCVGAAPAAAGRGRRRVPRPTCVAARRSGPAPRPTARRCTARA